MLSVSFTFHRSIGYYVMQVYAPDVLVVAISWTLFWVDKNVSLSDLRFFIIAQEGYPCRDSVTNSYVDNQNHCGQIQNTLSPKLKTPKLLL